MQDLRRKYRVPYGAVSDVSAIAHENPTAAFVMLVCISAG